MEDINVESRRIKRLPPYLFARVNQLKMEARWAGEDIIDLGMGNPDRPTPPHIVEKLCEVAHDPKAHRYSASRGIKHLRRAVCEWYKRRFDISLDYEKEAIVVIGSKEGIAHLSLAILDEGDLVIVPDPTYPIHMYSVVIAGGNVCNIPLEPWDGFLSRVAEAAKKMYPKAKVLILSFPHNPTTKVVEIDFFKEVVKLAKKHNLIVVHDIAYAEICFDGYKAPSFLEVEGAKDVGIEFYSLSKTYNMAGWRVGFAVGNERIIAALAKLKSYYDYGIFTPIQVAGIVALQGDQSCVDEVVQTYQRRRDVLVEGLRRIGWHVEKPLATMYVWAPLPEKFREMGSLDFSLLLLKKGCVAVSPGVGFGEHGEGFVRFALVENEHRIKQALRGIRKVLEEG